MREMTNAQLENVAGGQAPASCQAKAFASEAFGQALAGAGLGFLGGGAPGAGMGFMGGIITGNLYQGGKCISDLLSY